MERLHRDPQLSGESAGTGGVSPQEREVLVRWFGTLDGRQHSLEEIARELGVSARTVGRRRDNALNKIRHPERPVR